MSLQHLYDPRFLNSSSSGRVGVPTLKRAGLTPLDLPFYPFSEEEWQGFSIFDGAGVKEGFFTQDPIDAEKWATDVDLYIQEEKGKLSTLADRSKSPYL